MPVSDPPIRAHPGKPFRTWSDAARDRQVVTIRRNRCRRSQNFLAEDFALVFRPEQPVHLDTRINARSSRGVRMISGAAAGLAAYRATSP